MSFDERLLRLAREDTGRYRVEIRRVRPEWFEGELQEGVLVFSKEYRLEFPIDGIRYITSLSNEVPYWPFSLTQIYSYWFTAQQFSREPRGQGKTPLEAVNAFMRTLHLGPPVHTVIVSSFPTSRMFVLDSTIYPKDSTYLP